MKNKIAFLLIICLAFLMPLAAPAQCSICTRSVQQLGEKPATNLNAGIFYLAAAPLTVAGVIGYRWWRKNKDL